MLFQKDENCNEEKFWAFLSKNRLQVTIFDHNGRNTYANKVLYTGTGVNKAFVMISRESDHLTMFNPIFERWLTFWIKNNMKMLADFENVPSINAILAMAKRNTELSLTTCVNNVTKQLLK